MVSIKSEEEAMSALASDCLQDSPPPLVWLDAYDSGNPGIDRQHRELFSSVNTLIAEARHGVTVRTIELLDLLIMHAMEHFRYEEEELERLGFDRLDHHRHEHAVLLDRILTFRQELIDGSQAYDELIHLLADQVISRHMLGCDREFYNLISPR